MATNFPEDLDSFTNPQPTDSVAAVSHAAQHADANDAIEALQAKVGIDGSTDATSLDYRVTALESSPTDTEAIQDIVAGVLNAGTHTNITVTYDDDNNKISLAATYGDEQVIDAIATALTAGTGITKEFDDNLNTITISIDTNSIATQQYVTDAINNLVDSAPGLLDTLNELAAAIGDDANFATTINTAIANAITTANTYTDNAINALDTDDIEEGITNKYFTDQRALDATSTAYDPAGSASAAQTAAQLYADGLAVNYDPAGAAATAESNANTYTDNAIGNLDTDDIEEGITNKYFTDQRALDATYTAYDPAGAAAQALADANDYTDLAISGLGDTVENGYIPIGQKANPSGVASLDINGKVPSTQLDIDGTIQDISSQMLINGTHENISVTYDSILKTINLTATGGGGGASVTVSANPPASPNIGDLWLDSDNARTYAYDGSFWAEIGGQGQLASISSAPPSSPVQGVVWVDSDNAKSYIYDGMYWAEI